MNKFTFSKIVITILLGLITPYVHAQIGYQVCLINNATGEPRAMETVTVDLEITNKEGATIYSGPQSATTNDFGILSLSVGNTNTFKDADWGKLPFFISAKVDGILIGKSQILSVPVAEYAKTTGVLTIERLCKSSFTTSRSFSSGTAYHTFSFSDNGTGKYVYKTIESGHSDVDIHTFNWYKDGNEVLVSIDGNWGYKVTYIPDLDMIFVSDDGLILH